MDSQSQLLPFNGNSHRRKLTKKPPPSSHHHSSSISVDGRIDAQSIQSKRSSTSLRRAPSAPPVRTPTSNASNNSSPRYPPSQTANRSNPSPILPSGEFTGPTSPYPQQPHTTLSIRGNRHSHSPSLSNSHPHSRPLSSKTSEEFIGAPFDGSSILNRIEATKSPAAYLPPPRPAPAPPLAGPDTRAMGPPPPALRRSASFTAADSNADTLVNDDKGLSKVESSTLPPKRYSDEGKDQKPSGMLRKKSGFSGFMTSLVGSPKKPLISAPENPVHLTHVGYDSTTGQFTVRSLALSPLLSLFCPRRWRSCLLTDQ